MLETIQQLKRYFALTELVDKATYQKYGEFAWAFFDVRLLEVLLWLREGLNRPMVINNSTFQQRGLRTNISPLVQAKTEKGAIYLSAHNLGKGVDFHCPSLPPNAVREWIVENIDTCPYPIRLEDDKSAPTWVHIDVMNPTDKKVVLFSA